jgi:hypothetical protein
MSCSLAAAVHLLRLSQHRNRHEELDAFSVVTDRFNDDRLAERRSRDDGTLRGPLNRSPDFAASPRDCRLA